MHKCDKKERTWKKKKKKKRETEKDNIGSKFVFKIKQKF